MRKLLLVIIFLGLNGCMTAQEAAMKYDSQPASKLCYDYFNLPDYNIWQPDRRASIIRRNLDCSPYPDLVNIGALSNTFFFIMLPPKNASVYDFFYFPMNHVSQQYHQST